MQISKIDTNCKFKIRSVCKFQAPILNSYEMQIPRITIRREFSIDKKQKVSG